MSFASVYLAGFLATLAYHAIRWRFRTRLMSVEAVHGLRGRFDEMAAIAGVQAAAFAIGFVVVVISAFWPVVAGMQAAALIREGGQR